jgi:hypothetical protein
MAEMLARFGFETHDLQDRRVLEILEYKRQLNRAIAGINGQQYSPWRLAQLGRRFGFHASDLATKTNIAIVLKAVIDSELYLSSLRQAIDEIPTTETR